jgi:uncharacterized protein (TIGR02996 family)
MSLDPRLPEFQGFVRSMRASRGDDTPRLVFADWLEEQYPAAGWHTWLRRTVAIGQRFPDKMLRATGWVGGSPAVHKPWGPQFAEAAGLLRRLWWLAPPMSQLGEVANLWDFHRGYPDRVVIDYSTWREWGDRLCALGPVGEVVISDWPHMVVKHATSLVKVSLFDPPTRQGVDLPLKDWEHVIDERDWDKASWATQQRMTYCVAEKLLKQVWPTEVQKFTIDPAVLRELDPPGDA